MRGKGFVPVLVGLTVTAFGGVSYGAELSIYEIQSNTTDADASMYDGQIHDVAGGVVTHVWGGFNDRVYLRDPAHSSWGAIVVKDAEGGELSSAVNVGDWVSFDHIYIEEFRGTTFLQYRRFSAPDVSFTVESTGNRVPDPPVLVVGMLGYPANHTVTEPFESMVVTLKNVLVGQMDLGKAEDNYELIRDGQVAWATDYMNVDAGGPYDPRIETDAVLASVTGVVEQYSDLPSGWDYYQLNTRSADDIVYAGTIPTVSQWGLVIVALLLLAVGKVGFGRERPEWAKV